MQCYHSRDTAVPGWAGVGHVSGGAGALGGGRVQRGTESVFFVLRTTQRIYAVRGGRVVNRIFLLFFCPGNEPERKMKIVMLDKVSWSRNSSSSHSLWQGASRGHPQSSNTPG